ncbi:MAG: PH domain-containing protein, partial [Clostridia bacterium]|nr:PH domain-containing protein [Clostridia bacterium]
SLFYSFGVIILTLIVIVTTVFCIYFAATTSVEENHTVVVLYYLIPFFVASSIFFVCYAGFFLIQYTIISDLGITVRAPFRTIRKIKWEEIKEVREEKFYISVDGAFQTGWIIFDDGIDRPMRNGLVRKNTYIVVPNKKRNKKIIRMFYDGDIQG